MKHFFNQPVGMLLLLILGISFSARAQTTVSGTVQDASTQEPLAGVNILIKGRLSGTTTDNRGNFQLSTSTPPPFTLVISAIGYDTQEQEISSQTANLTIRLQERVLMGQEVVVSASRVEENIMQSPVTVEKMDILAIRETPAASFYEALANLKGVDLNTQSLTFRSVNMRGFNANGQVRVVQMVDGMDNQAPGLNFAVGNIAGTTELDLESVEVLPGAASALYGPNAVNGIVLMNSRSPFRYQGLSAQTRLGVMHVDGRQRPASPMYDLALRYAKAFNDKFAFKVNVGYLRANDWRAQDYRDQSLLNGFTLESGNRLNNPGYNGVNTYGDENSQNMASVAQSMINAGALPSAALPLIPQNTFVSRTGYTEEQVVDYVSDNLKGNAAIHWRINENVEAILQGNFGTGTSVYTGQDRYYLNNFILSQYKAEVRGSNFFLRAYTTRENSGDTYAAGVLSSLMNEQWKPSQLWYPQYVGAFVQARSQGVDVANAHAAARNFADQGRILPGSAEFDRAFEEITNTPIGVGQGGRPLGGSRFLDRTSLYHAEGMYNFSDQIKFMELIAGANYRVYALNSQGTLFARDNDGREFNINEYGGYVQGAKRVLDERLKLTASIRVDKNMNFRAQYSPRASAVYTFLNNQNIRASFQTGFRLPTTQEQYIDLQTPQARILGGLPFLRDRYNMSSNPVYSLEEVTRFGGAFLAATQSPQNQQQAQAEVQAQVEAGQIPPDQAQAAVIQRVVQLSLGQTAPGLSTYQFNEFQPERVQTYEIGYKGLIGNKLFIDSYYYFTNFQNFIGTQILVQSNVGVESGQPSPVSPLGLIGLGAPPAGQPTRNVYSVYVNRPEVLRSQGWGLSLNYALPGNYMLGSNVAYNVLINEAELGDFQAGFNSPRYRTNVSFSNREVFQNLGFSATWRWQDAFIWQSAFVGPEVLARNQSVVPAFHTFDAQVSYKISPLKSIIRIGGSNLFNRYYRQAWGNPSVGGLYYISLTFDELLN